MTVRVGHIERDEDVHGVSGTGRICEIFEASNGKVVVIWVTSTPSVVVFDSLKAAEFPHSHGGKTRIVWDWESPKDEDPMDAVFARKLEEAGGSVEATGATAPEQDEAEKEAEAEAEAEAIADELVEETADMVDRVSEKTSERMARKLKERTAEKVAEKAAEKAAKNGD
jgi:hypothetical protein